MRQGAGDSRFRSLDARTLVRRARDDNKEIIVVTLSVPPPSPLTLRGRTNKEWIPTA